MDVDKTIDAFRRGVLDLDCKNIILAQRQVDGERFEGQGYIKQDTDRTLVFKIYVCKHQNATLFRRHTAQANDLAGKILADDMFYDLEAIGRDGTRWTATQIIPSMNWDMTDSSVLASGQLRSITALLDTPQPQNYLRLHFFEEYKLPLRLMSKVQIHDSEYMVLDRAEFEAMGAIFEVRMRENSSDTIVQVTSSTPLPAFFHLRIGEALQYITGQAAICQARLESEQDKLVIALTSPRRKTLRTQFDPPISPASIHFHQYGWKLFDRYLAYVMAKTEGTYWNPVAYHLHNACEATASSLDAWAVAVSVAVEAVASLIEMANDPEERRKREERLTLFQDRMRQCLAAQTDFADLSARMKGSIDSMGNKRPEDTLYALANIGRVEKAYVKAWRYLRNRHVHPSIKDLNKPDPTDYQNLFDNIRRVEVLLRQLTFYLIGYEGPFTDYATANFASKQYPLTESGTNNP